MTEPQDAGSLQTDPATELASPAPPERELPIADPAEAAALDVKYARFPPFEAWAELRLDSAAWEAKFGEYRERRDRSSAESLVQAVEVALRAAALETGAIEGLYFVDSHFTTTIATRDAGWETLVEERGSNFQAMLQAHIRAYELALELSKSPIGVTEAWIRELHKELCSAQRTYRVLTPAGVQEQDLPLGTYKHFPNHVRLPDGSHRAYAPVLDTASEMQRLVREFQGAAFQRAHVVLQASYAHYALVCVHPFADGNGRVARALASTFLCRGIGIPLVVFADQQQAYWNVLEGADRGRLQLFVDFIFERGVDSIDFVSDRLGASPRAQAERLAKILRGSGVLTPAEIDAASLKALQLVQDELQRQATAIPLPPGVSLSTGGKTQQQPPFNDEHYRSPGPGSWDVALASVYSLSPQVVVNFSLHALAAKSGVRRYICAIRNSATNRLLEIRPDEIMPLPTAALLLKLSSFVERSLAEALSDFGTRAELALTPPSA